MKSLGRQSLSQRLHLDVPLCFGLLMLCGLGLVVLYSASGEDLSIVIRQATRMAVAFVFMFLVAQLSPTVIERWSIWIFIAGIAMLGTVLWAGYVGKGAQRWLDLGFFRFQPSEIMKLSVPMVIAWYLANKTLPPNIGSIIIVGLMIIIPAALIAKQPDLGTSLLVAAAGLSILFIAGMSWKLMIIFGALCGMCAPLLWYFMHDYQRQRVLTLFYPEQDPLGTGYHIIQSMIAIGSGGIYGKGWLNGTQSHLEFLPERSTDFIFAVYCEEFGLIGVLLLLCIYLFVVARGLYIAVNAQQTYGKLLAAALTLTFCVYVIVNIAMVIGQLPVVGVPLPLISYGGTSIVTLMLAFGILMSIHTHRRVYTN
jgi:rod shape determining protein RodA